MMQRISFETPYHGLVRLVYEGKSYSSEEQLHELLELLHSVPKLVSMPWISLTQVSIGGVPSTYVCFQPTGAYEFAGELLALNSNFELPLNSLAAALERPLSVIDSFQGKYRFLSNFYSNPVSFDGLRFENSEAAYQAAKTLDAEQRKEFQKLSASKAKRRGQRVTLRSDWDTVSAKLMYEILEAKFLDAELRKLLLATGSAKLVEGNTWHDQRWGDCRCGRAACSEEGENMLGRLLMTLRSSLQASS